MELEKSVLYVDIDALFDTRAAVLATFGMEKALVAISKGYYDRNFDEFEGIDTEEYKKRYAERDRSILRNSLTTPIARHIQMFIHQTQMAAINSPYRRHAKIVLNTYPYQLTEQEITFQVLGLRALTKHEPDIEVINASYAEITPDFVKANYVRMIMYNYWDWLEVHSVTKALADSRCQLVSLIGPRLVKSREAEKQLRGIDTYTALEDLTSRFIQLCLFPISEYCVDLRRLEKHLSGY